MGSLHLRPTHLQVHHPGHHQGGHQQVCHGQAHHQIVGGGLQGPFLQHGHTHQTISKDDRQDEHAVGEGIVGMWAGPAGPGGVLCRTRGVDVAPQLAERRHSPEGEEGPRHVYWEEIENNVGQVRLFGAWLLWVHFLIFWFDTYFGEHFLYAGHYSKPWIYSNEKNRKKSLPSWSLHSREDSNKQDKSKMWYVQWWHIFWRTKK